MKKSTCPPPPDPESQDKETLEPEIAAGGQAPEADGEDLELEDEEDPAELEPEEKLTDPVETAKAIIAESQDPVPADAPAAQEEKAETEAGLLPVPQKDGTVIAGRYEIVALLEETPATLLYDALDHRRCAQCGYADSAPEDIFCANCGAVLEGVEPPHVHLRALRVAGEAIIELEEANEGRIEQWLEADGQLYAVFPPPAEEPEMEAQEASPFGRGVRHIVGYNSDVGLKRELDEDALLTFHLAPMFESESRPSLGLYAVADGMGGHEGGEVASRLAIEVLVETLTKRLFIAELSGEPVLPETPVAMLKEAIQSINTCIYNLQQKTGSDMGTTITAALVRDDQALIANVGDSRTYLWRGGELNQLTTDHSLVAQLVAAEMIAPHEVYSHPDKSAIYRSLGHMPEIEVDIFPQTLEPGDRLLLCCDGVWEMLRDDGIEEVLLLEADPQRACDEIVRRSNLAGGEDNISVVIVQFEKLANG